MRINEQRTYIMYLSVEEFELMHPITESVPYGFCYFRKNDQEEEYIIQVEGEEMLEEMKEKLEYEQYVQEYEECNSYMVERIRELLNEMYLELR